MRCLLFLLSIISGVQKDHFAEQYDILTVLTHSKLDLNRCLEAPCLGSPSKMPEGLVNYGGKREVVVPSLERARKATGVLGRAQISGSAQE